MHLLCNVNCSWSVAQFGLIPLIAKGYGTLGYIAIFVIILPIILKFYFGSALSGKKTAADNQ